MSHSSLRHPPLVVLASTLALLLLCTSVVSDTSAQIIRNDLGTWIGNSRSAWSAKGGVSLSLSVLDNSDLRGVSPQSANSSYREWANLGLGDANLGLNYNFSWNDRLWHVGYTFRGALFDLFGGGMSFGVDDEGYSIHAVDVAVGRGVFDRFFAVGLFLGPAILSGQKPSGELDSLGDPVPETYISGGAVASGQVFLKPLPEIGVGVEVFGNANPIKSVAGWRLSVQVSNNLVKVSNN